MRSGARRFGARRIGAGQWQMAGAAAAADMAAYGHGELSRGRESLRARGRSSAGAHSQPMFSNRLVGPGRLGTDQAINRD